MKILLRFCEMAPVCLLKIDSESIPELIPARYDLFPHDGGFAWGYEGSGVYSLAYAIISKLQIEIPDLDTAIDIKYASQLLVKRLLSTKNQLFEHDLDAGAIAQFLMKNAKEDRLTS